MEGISTADDVAKSIKPKMIVFTILSVFYDIPRVYLNMNLFGPLCTFYYNVILNVNNVVTLRFETGEFHIRDSNHSIYTE